MNLHLILASLTATLSLGIAAQAAPAKVACVGDSITFGTGLKPGETRYPQVLATLMVFAIIYFLRYDTDR